MGSTARVMRVRAEARAARADVERALDHAARVAGTARWPWNARLSYLVDCWLILEERGA
jgi:hypothetical protein